MNMLVIEHGPEISMPGAPQVFGHRRHLPVAGGGRARRGSGPGQLPCSSARLSTLVALAAQRVHARREVVVQPHEVVAELGGEERGRALHGHDADAVGGGASWPGGCGHGGVSPFGG